MRGSEHTFLYVDVEELGTDIVLYVIRDTPLGLSELEHKLTLSLLPGSGQNAKERLREALTAILGHL